MENIYCYLMLIENAKQKNLTPEEQKNLNQFLRGTADLAV